MLKAVLFDFDGVLTTDATGSESICKYISAKVGISYELFSGIYRKFNKDLLYGWKTHIEIWDEFCGELGFNIDKNLLIESFIHTPIDFKMIEFVRRLKQLDYKIGMVTDNKADRIEKIIQYHRWEKLFDVVSVSATIGSGKDQEAIFQKTLDDLNLTAAECVFIDNSEKNLIVPSKMGLKTIFFDDRKRDMAALKQALPTVWPIVNDRGSRQK